MMEEIDGPIRSRFRGLSWDKKHQGWRVRIYYSGKQRHVGRFEDDVAAAKAYDKAAVYLYGANAITNFGIHACQEDPTEVSPFIVLAKEQADQEQQARSQQRHQQFGVQQLSDMYAAAGASPLMMLPNGSVMQQPQLQQQNLQATAMQLTDLCAWNPHHQQPGVAVMASAAHGLHHYADATGFHPANSIAESLQAQPQQHWLPPAQAVAFAPNQNTLLATLTSPISQGISNGPYLMLSTPSSMDTNSSAASSSSTAMSAGSNISSNGNGAMVLGRMISPGTPSINMGSTATTVSPGARAAGIMTPQHLDATAVSSFPALAAQLHQQQGQGQPVPLLLQQVAASSAAQASHQDQGVAISAGYTQPLQQQLLLLTGSQPLQLSVQPQLTTMAGHLNMHQQALQQAQQPFLLVQHQPQQQVQLVGLPTVSLDPQPVMSGSTPLALRTTSQTAPAALVGNGIGCGTPAEQLPRPEGPGLSFLPTSANVGLVVNGMACSSTDSFVEDMLQGLGYTSAMLSGGTAAMHHQQAAGPMLQQQQQLMANGVVVSVNRDCLGVNGMVDCNSSVQSCSPQLAASACAALPASTSAPMAAGGGDAAVAPPIGCSIMSRASALVKAHAPVTGAAGSPTFSSSSSSGSSSSKSFGLHGRIAC